MKMEGMSYAQRVASRRRAVFLRRARRVVLIALAAAAMLVAEVSLINQLVNRGEAAAVVREGGPEAAAALIPVPVIVQVEASDPPEGCAADAALTAKDPDALMTAFGGAEAMHAAILAGEAPCVPLDDQAMPWVVVNKHRPLQPLDYAPAELAVPPSHVVECSLSAEVIEPYEQLVAAAAK